MGIFGAMTTAVSGLKAQSYAMENISGNIANSRTTGFKRVDTNFVDLIPDRPAGQEQAGSVQGRSLATNTIQGDLNTTGVAENIAINGEGFFVVRESTGFAGGQPTFGGIDVYTRRGDFNRDNNGYLVNGAGYFLKGIPLDPATGSLVGSNPQLVKINRNNIPPKETANIEYAAQLPSSPLTNYQVQSSNQTVPAAGLMNAGAAPYGPNPATITGAQNSAFIDRTIAGGSVNIFNQQGASKPINLRWGKVTNANTVGPILEQWNLYYQNDSTAVGPATAWTKLGATIDFDTAGLPTPVNPLLPVNLPAFTLDGTPYNALNLNMSNLTSNPPTDVNGNRSTAKVTVMSPDGYGTGEFISTSIDQSGRVVGNYSNGQVVGLAQIVLARFNAANDLKRGDGGVFQATLESGQPIIDQAGSNVQGGTVENSNTDIADEFSKMIVTQQAYSANTRVISTSSDMLRDVINIIR
jgi:flagellar hook protein FlgE